MLDSWRYKESWQPVTVPAAPSLTGEWLVVLASGGASAPWAEAALRTVARHGGTAVPVELPDGAGRAEAAGLLRAALAGSGDEAALAGVVSLLALAGGTLSEEAQPPASSPRRSSSTRRWARSPPTPPCGAPPGGRLHRPLGRGHRRRPGHPVGLRPGGGAGEPRTLGRTGGPAARPRRAGRDAARRRAGAPAPRTSSRCAPPGSPGGAWCPRPPPAPPRARRGQPGGPS
ncbi:hypothetical protein ACFQVA_41395 [Actinomadura keratinilytica]